MRKAILISIKPKWVAKILNGEKTIEIRKTMPKSDLPIDVYIYCTKNNKHKLEYCDYNGGCWSANDGGDYFNGKVVAKFTLRKVEQIIEGYTQGETMYDWTEHLRTEEINGFELLKKSCLTEAELHKYVDYFTKKTHYGYAWHIEDLVIFDEPKELKEFAQWGFSKYYYSNHDNESYMSWADKCERYHFGTIWEDYRGPQSWCYIEQEEE